MKLRLRMRLTMLEKLNPWHPITDSCDLKHLGKLQEEINEQVEVLGKLGKVVSRCIIQGMDGVNPSDGKVNKQWLAEEVADVIGNSELVIEHFGLDQEFIRKRVENKKLRLRTWHEMA